MNNNTTSANSNSSGPRRSGTPSGGPTRKGSKQPVTKIWTPDMDPAAVSARQNAQPPRSRTAITTSDSPFVMPNGTAPRPSDAVRPGRPPVQKHADQSTAPQRRTTVTAPPKGPATPTTGTSRPPVYYTNPEVSHYSQPVKERTQLAKRASDGLPNEQMRRGRIAKLLFELNVVIVIGLFIFQGGLENVNTAAGLTSAAGRLTGLIGTNLILVQLVLMGRHPTLNRLFGIDQLTRWHRTIGHVAFEMIVAHVFLIIIGYAQLTNTAVWKQASSLLFANRDMLMATASFALLILIVVTSVNAAKKKLRFETWHFIHLYAYLAVVLAVPHQLSSGADFKGHAATQIYWAILYAFTVGTVLIFRIGLPLRNSITHDLHVVDVIEESPDAVSVYIAGRNLERLRAKGGQFFVWRFLTKGQWWQAHPYSLSAAPKHDELRITVRNLGDGSGDVINIPIGTRVIAEGPYGTFTEDTRTQRKVLLVAGGVGVTPIRALLETMPARDGDLTLIYRLSKRTDALFVDELSEIGAERNAKMHVVIGGRKDFPPDRQPLEPDHLAYLVPDIDEHDVYVCGPPGMTNRVLESLHELGLPEHQIHHETFG